jgi:hypothetical protein
MQIKVYQKIVTILFFFGACYMCAHGMGANQGHEQQSRGRLPRIPELIFGANQINIGKPPLAGADGNSVSADKYRTSAWPLTDADTEWLKSLGCNTIRFPVYPNEVGIDESLLLSKTKDGHFNPSVLGEPDWRSLDWVMDWMIRHQLTPNVCPGAEFQTDDWSSKTWMSLHVPESAERAVWFTKLVVDHLSKKYGDQIIYGWYEDWWWNSYKHENSVLFPGVFRKKLAEMYGQDITALNRAWGSSYNDFEKVEVPVLLAKGSARSNYGVVNPSAVNSRRTYDLRKAMDLLHRDVLTELHAYIKQKSPGSLWIGSCMLNQLGGLADIRTVPIPRCNATMRTAALTGDVVSADLYSDTLEYYSHYRTYSKFAASEGKKLLIAEVPAIKPRSFKLIADVGGPSAGALAWCGKWDLWGLIKGDSTRRTENGTEWRRLYDTYKDDRERYANYKRGSIYVYFPEETLSYTISDKNFVDAFLHICDHMMPEELELVLTDEIEKLPSDVRLYVLERTLPLEAIEKLQRRDDQVVSFHTWFMDENGRKHTRNVNNDRFFERLLLYPEGKKLLDVFQRVEERANNVAYTFVGAGISTKTTLAGANAVLPDRPNLLENLINGDIVSGITFSDQAQDEWLLINLGQPRMIYGAFVDFFEGDGQFNGPSRMPERVVISVSLDGDKFTPITVLSGADLQLRSRCRFAQTHALWVRFDFGKNTAGAGLKLVNLGVLGEQKESEK